MTDTPAHTTLDKLQIWQQNLNKSHIVQLTLLNSTPPREWDILALQEPSLNSLGNTRANTHWRVVYPTAKYTNGDKPRVVTLISSRISTDAWKQIEFPLADVVIVQIRMSQGMCTLFNIYNDCTHDDTVSALERYMPENLPALRPTEQDHLVWLGNFNCHHPLWDEDRNNHLFTEAALAASQKLIDILADYGLTQILPKDIPTLQSTSSGNWTRPDKVFCTDHTCGTLVSCNTDPERRGPNTDHVPVLTQFDMSLAASVESPSWNYHEVDWEKFNSAINNTLSNTPPPPRLDNVEAFQTAARNLDTALRNTVEALVPKTRPHPHQKRWWTKDLTK